MSRLDTCITRITEKYQTTHKKEDIKLLYQEIMNYLPTYKEKKAFSVYYAELTKNN